MADPRMVGHSRWLLVFILVCGFRNGLCDISLTMEKKVTGYKGESVVIPCTYTASGNVEVVKIEWEFKNGPKSELVIYRTESEDHISLIKYRNRAAISKSPTGDVSLTLKKLDISDRGNFHCKVTRKDSSGKVITKEDFSVLTILRKKTATSDGNNAENEEFDIWTTRPPTKKPEVTTEETEVTTTTPATTKPDGKVSTSGEDPNLTTLEILPTTKPDVKVITTEEKPEITTATPTTNNPNGKVGTTGDDPNLTTPGNPVSSLDEELTPTKNLQTVTENLVTETPKMGTETLARRDITTRVSNDGDDRAVVTTRHPWGFHTHAVPTPTTEVVHDSAPAAASSGSGMFLYIVIIGLLCIVSVFILTIVMIVRRKKRKSFIYNIPTMNQLAINLEGRSCAGGGCQSLVESASNDYELHLPISEYESVQLCSNEYEQLVIRNPEGNGSCCHTSQ
ncbi:V-set and immunoglobulin domain-containing protein 4 isoform X6 [Pyxicephalus adspersus]|uniref:V-set and immunoglobulin domain-containing protein 4 isoform X6 n=1 Tax=Pyxicephalus adspersus TaxID=30357 RepID=UPI003B5A6C47